MREPRTPRQDAALIAGAAFLALGAVGMLLAQTVRFQVPPSAHLDPKGYAARLALLNWGVPGLIALAGVLLLRYALRGR